MKKYKLFLFYALISVLTTMLSSCAQIVVGGAASGDIILVQERSAKQAAIDILAKTQIEEAMFSNSYDNLFSKIRVIVYEGRVLLVGTVKSDKLRVQAEEIANKVKNVTEVANYIVIGNNDIVDYIKDTRISLELKAKLLTDKDISEVNFSVTTENRVLFIIGIAQDKQELSRVLNHASDIAGVKKIINLVLEKNDPKRAK